MKILVSLYRLLIAVGVAIGISDLWHGASLNKLVFFTYQSNIAVAIVMIWSVAALLIKGVQPPAWLKGCLVLYIAVTALVAALILPPSDPTKQLFVFGIMRVNYLHIIVPIATILDFLLFDEHKRYRWHYALSWMVYFFIYIAFVLIRAELFPHSGPGDHMSPYPYAFMNLKVLGWHGIGINTVEYLGAFLVLGAIIVLIDRFLPKKVLTAY